MLKSMGLSLLGSACQALAALQPDHRMRTEGVVALVTGADRGVGAALAISPSRTNSK